MLLGLAAMALPQAASGAQKTFEVQDVCGPNLCGQIWNVPKHVTSATFEVNGGEGETSIYFPDQRAGDQDRRAPRQYTACGGAGGKSEWRYRQGGAKRTARHRAVW